MHSYGETAANVPAFLIKLLRLVDDEETNNLISWNSDGRSFVIRNQAKFAKELLPLNYKHNNMASFIRQLNMYGFHKITSIDNGGLKFDKDEMEFSHPYFQRGQSYLLEHIKRKIANPKISPEDKSVKNVEAVAQVLNEVKSMRGQQESLDSRFCSMKQENEALWREIAMLRQKHLKQQQIVNKLIQFLVTMVQPTRSGLSGMGSGKRRFQLMINDAPQSSKIKKINDESAIISEFGEELLDEAQIDADSDHPIISDVPHVHSPDSLSNHSTSINADENIDDEEEERRTSEVDNLTENIIVNDYINMKNPQYKYLVRARTMNEDSNYDNDNNEVVNTPLMKKALANKRKQEREKYIQTAKKQNRQNNKSKNNNNVTIKIEHDDDDDSCEYVPPTTNTVAIAPARSNVMKTRSNKPATTATLNEKSQKLDNNKRKNSKSLLTGNIFNNDEQQQTNKKPKMTNNILDADIEYVDYDYNVPTETVNILQNTLNNTNNNVSKKTLYSKDAFLNADIPNELFADDSNQNLELNSSPLIGGYNIEGGSYNPNISFGKKTATTDDGATDSISPSTSTSSPQSNALQLAKFNSPPLLKPNDNILKLNTPSDFDYHLDNVQNDLDTLKDLLRGEGYQFDANTLLGLFGNDDVLPYELTLPNDIPGDKRIGTADNLQNNEPGSGAELISYNPVPIDLSELLDIDGCTDTNSNNLTEEYADNINSNVLNTPAATPRSAPTFKQISK